MSCCSVADCSNYSRRTTLLSKKIIYHVFPKDPLICKQWSLKCSRIDPINFKRARICSDHFTDDDYKDDLRNRLLGLPLRKILKPSAVPSINLPNYTESKKLSSIQRNEQHIKRNILSAALEGIRDLSPKHSRSQGENGDGLYSSESMVLDSVTCSNGEISMREKIVMNTKLGNKIIEKDKPFVRKKIQCKTMDCSNPTQINRLVSKEENFPIIKIRSKTRKKTDNLDEIYDKEIELKSQENRNIEDFNTTDEDNKNTMQLPEVMIGMLEEADTDNYHDMASNVTEMEDPLNISDEKSTASQQKLVRKKRNNRKRQKNEDNSSRQNSPKLKNQKRLKRMTKNNCENKNNNDLQNFNNGTNKENNVNYEDEDKQFLLSLLPAMKELLGPQKWQFKITILNELRKLQYTQIMEEKIGVIDKVTEIEETQQDVTAVTSSQNLNVKPNEILVPDRNKLPNIPTTNATAIPLQNVIQNKVTTLQKAASTSKTILLPQKNLQLNETTSSTNTPKNNITFVSSKYLLVNNSLSQTPGTGNLNFITYNIPLNQQGNICQRISTNNGNQINTNSIEEPFRNDFLESNLVEIPQSNIEIKNNNSNLNASGSNPPDINISKPTDNDQENPIWTDTNENPRTELSSEITLEEIKLESIKIEPCDESEYYCE